MAANLQALCNAVGITRDTYTRYRLHPSAPLRAHDGYPIEPWRQFLREFGVTTDAVRREQLGLSDLKAGIMAEDLEMRRIAKARMVGSLIDRAEADARMILLASIFAADLTNLRDRVSSLSRDGFVRVEDIQLGLQDCLNNVRAKVSEQSFDRRPEVSP